MRHERGSYFLMNSVTKKRKYILAAVLAVFTLFLFTACGTAQLQQPPVDSGVEAINLEGTCTVERVGDNLRVYCSSNVENGAVVKLTLDTYDGMELASKTYTKQGDDIYAEFAIEPSWKGEIFGSMTCSPADQPAEITEKYGKRFQNIRGDQVIFDVSGNIFVAQSESFQLDA